MARYSDEDAMIERLSVMAPAMVSGTNTWIPNHEGTKDRHEQSSQQPNSEPQQKDQDPNMSGGGQDMELVTKLVQGDQSTPEMQWVRTQMQQAQSQETQEQPGGLDANLGAIWSAFARC